MRSIVLGRPARAVGLGLAALVLGVGCGGGDAFRYFGGLPFPYVGSGGGTSGPGSSGTTPGSGLGGDTGGFTDPCEEPQSRKFVRISMRNQSPDYIHYFLALIALVNSDTYPTGTVCPDDISLYTSFGYQSIPAGGSTEFGNYCIEGPALIYFHRGGQFRTAGGSGTGNLASAIAPAQGSTPSYDAFFTSAGATVPIPTFILLHNPGQTAAGQALLVSQHIPSPCTQDLVSGGDPVCAQDSFYYVDETDRITGSSALGVGSGRRTPGEIQGTACECGAIAETGAQAFQVLAPSGRSAPDAACNEFMRGGRIEYVFVRDDTDPPYPQLVWQVSDSTGTRVHSFDPRANIR